MSARSIESLHPATWASIQMQGDADLASNWPVTGWRCGCTLTQSGKVWLCQYHEGVNDGIDLALDETAGA